MNKAKEIQQPGEKWQDAVKRASALLKTEKPAPAPKAPKAEKPAATKAPATAPAKVDGKWSVNHNGETLPFPSRKKAARYYRANR